MMKKTTMGMLALMLATMTACERVVLYMDEDMDKEVSEESGRLALSLMRTAAAQRRITTTLTTFPL